MNDLQTTETTAPPAGTALATTRQAQEVQAAMIVARRFPRDIVAATARIVESCKRALLAEQALYEYSKGGKKICGPSIRLAEVMAQSWGNLDFGVTELERGDGDSVACSYCWDLETNTRQTKIFTVRHILDTKEGPKILRSDRDIYEHVANMAARRMRACILGVIPGDIQDLAVEACNKTLMGMSDSKEPFIDRVRKMVVAFGEFDVSQEMIEARLQHPVTSISPNQFAQLRRIYTSIKDGVANREDHFDLNAGQPKATTLGDIVDREKGTQKPAEPTTTEQAPTDTADPSEAGAASTEGRAGQGGPQAGQEVTNPTFEAEEEFAECNTPGECDVVYERRRKLCTNAFQKDQLTTMCQARQDEIHVDKSKDASK